MNRTKHVLSMLAVNIGVSVLIMVGCYAYRRHAVFGPYSEHKRLFIERRVICQVAEALRQHDEANWAAERCLMAPPGHYVIVNLLTHDNWGGAFASRRSFVDPAWAPKTPFFWTLTPRWTDGLVVQKDGTVRCMTLREWEELVANGGDSQVYSLQVRY